MVRRLARPMIAMGASLLAAGLAAPALSAEIPESSDPIRFVLLDWTGNHLTNHIAGEILSRMGYNVEYTAAAQAVAWQGLADGDLHANAEQWLVTQKQVFDELAAEGKVESLGELGLVGGEAWYYPAYLESQCAGLPNWEALKDCTDLFVTPETSPKGRLLDFPPEWTPESPIWIDTFGFNLAAVPAGSEGAAIAEVKSAVSRQEPILLMFYEPHWAVVDYGLKAVELPAYAPECKTDPAWGPIPDKIGDCYEPAPEIVKVAWSGLDQKWPAAAKVLEQLAFTNSEQAPLIRMIDNEGQTVETVAKQWVDQHEETWRPWVESARE